MSATQNKTFKQLKSMLLTMIILGILGIGCLLFYISKSTQNAIYTAVDSLPSKYVAVIFGAGIRPDGTPSKYLKDRLDAGIFLYNNQKVKRILLSGDNGHKSYDELQVMKDYCVKAGVPKRDIFVDYAGFDTYSTVYRAKDLFKVDNAIMVTQAYHLKRALFLCRNLNIDAVGFAADNGGYQLAAKNKLREQLALVKCFVDVNRNRKPKYYGGNIDIKGPSNFDKQ
jgi:SanA protein